MCMCVYRRKIGRKAIAYLTCGEDLLNYFNLLQKDCVYMLYVKFFFFFLIRILEEKK